jgi:hypothetical protein
LVEAIRYKPEVQVFDSQWGHWDFSLTQPPTDVSTRDVYWGLRRPVRRDDNLPLSCADF